MDRLPSVCLLLTFRREGGFVVGEEGRQALRRGLPHPEMENTEIYMISFQLSQFPSCQP